MVWSTSDHDPVAATFDIALPDIHILSPADGTTFTAMNGVNVTIPITVATDNFDIPADGHWHLWVDGEHVGPVMEYATTTDLLTGTHVISAELRNASHQPLGPVDTVTVTVQEVGITIVTPFEGQVFTATNNVSVTIQITVATLNFVIPDDGHWHLWVNGVMVEPVFDYAAFLELNVGTHVILVELRDSSHQPLGPTDTVTVVVRAEKPYSIYLPLIFNQASR